VDQTTAELQERLIFVPGGAVLFLTMEPCGLAYPGIFQFQGGKGKAVDKKDQINCFSMAVSRACSLVWLTMGIFILLSSFRFAQQIHYQFDYRLFLFAI